MKVEDLKLGMKVRFELDALDKRKLGKNQSLDSLVEQGYGYVLEIGYAPSIGITPESGLGSRYPFKVKRLTPYEDEVVEERQEIKAGDLVRITEGAEIYFSGHKVGGVYEVLSVGRWGVYLYSTPGDKEGYFYDFYEVELVDPLDEVQELTQDEYYEETYEDKCEKGMFTRPLLVRLIDKGFSPGQCTDLSGSLCDWFELEVGEWSVVFALMSTQGFNGSYCEYMYYLSAYNQYNEVKFRSQDPEALINKIDNLIELLEV